MILSEGVDYEAEAWRLQGLLQQERAKIERVEALMAEWDYEAGANSRTAYVFGPQSISVIFALGKLAAALAEPVERQRKGTEMSTTETRAERTDALEAGIAAILGHTRVTALDSVLAAHLLDGPIAQAERAAAAKALRVAAERYFPEGSHGDELMRADADRIEGGQ